MDNNYNYSMYNNNDNMYNTPGKMDKKKLIELIVLIFLIIWGVTFGVNYLLYTKGEKPVFLLPLKHKYQDGVIIDYLGIGYIYRVYDRSSIKMDEFVPFWSPIKKSTTQENGLPLPYSDYEVPDNNEYRDKYKSLIYFFDGSELLGTYKCITTSNGCNKAFGGYDKYNIENTEPLTRLKKQPVIDSYANRYGFIDDSNEQTAQYGSIQYNRTIYIYDIEENKLLAKYADIKYQYVDDFDKGRIAKNGNITVKDDKTKKWGIINLSKKGEITQVLPFEYDSVNYDQDTGYYILCKDGKWYVYNLKKKEKVTQDYNDVIYDVWENNNMNYYIKTGRRRIVGEEEFISYQIFNTDGRQLQIYGELINVYEAPSWIMYLNRVDKRLHFIDYSGEEKTNPIQLNFTEMEYDKMTHPAFKMNLSENGYMILSIYDGRSINDNWREVSISTVTWDD